jgi:hypothetical protein
LRLAWLLDGFAAPLQGLDGVLQPIALGRHTLTLEVTDSEGKVCRSEVKFDVE